MEDNLKAYTHWLGAAQETLDLVADSFRLNPCIDRGFHFDPQVAGQHGSPTREQWGTFLRQHPGHVDTKQHAVAWWLASDRDHVDGLPDENYKKLAGALIGAVLNQEELAEIASTPIGGY